MRFVRFLIGILLLPACAGFSLTALDVLLFSAGENTLWTSNFALMSCGFLAWIAVYFALPSPTRLYILSHELTHALWGLLMGAKVSSLKVGREGGSVELSKTNFLIMLAPYFFPFYTVLLIAAFYFLSFFFDLKSFKLVWLFLVGFTWGFHFTFTLSSLLQKQSDIQKCGVLFSYSIIYLFNIAVLCIWLAAVSGPGLKTMAHTAWKRTSASYAWTAKNCAKFCSFILNKLNLAEFGV